MSRPGHQRTHGPVAWMARNSVPANLLMAGLMVGGLIMGRSITQEVFPEFDLDMVIVSVPYPGASPEEVEKGVIKVAEEAISQVDGIKRVTSTAAEGAAAIVIDVLETHDANKVLADVKNAVDRIPTLPKETERPIVSVASSRREVISLIVYGQTTPNAEENERVLRKLADRIREDLLADRRISVVELDGVRAPEISVEIPQAVQRTFGLGLEQVAQRIRQRAVELSAGGIKTKGGEVLLRTSERKDWAREFAQVTLLNSATGQAVRLGDVADVRETFADVDRSAAYNGKPAVKVRVYRVGDETPTGVADAVNEYIERTGPTLPPGIGLATWGDRSEMLRDRMDLLMRNAYLGLALVLLVLGLFLDIRLAFWVTMGIPISFLGSLLLMPSFGVSINMISLFAFIVTLGMVVDDAIIIGENIYTHRQRGLGRLEASIVGAREMAKPVTFTILTTVAAFSPLFFVPGVMGKFFGVIPIIVCCVLMISLVESLFILPAHLAHAADPATRGPMGWVNRAQQRVSVGLEWLIRWTYAPVLHLAIRNRYLVVGVGVALLLVTVGWVAGDRIEKSFMPKVARDQVMATVVLPYGVALEDTEKVRDRLLATAQDAIDEMGGDSIVRGIYAEIGSKGSQRGAMPSFGADGGSHLANVEVSLVPSGERTFSATEFAQRWRQKLGKPPGVESLTFSYTTGPGSGAEIDVQLMHQDIHALESAATELAEILKGYGGVKDIDHGFAAGKPQLDFRVTPQAEALGLEASDMARQVRAQFYGAEALRQQRDRDEVRVMVRLTEAERRSEYHLEELIIRTPKGGEMPVAAAARIERGRSYTTIRRVDGDRVVSVTADIVPGQANPNKVLADLKTAALPALVAKYPGLRFSFEGAQRDQRESMAALGRGFLWALLLIYALIAVPFKSYTQPLIVMTAIPFGIVGAVLGHIIMGFGISLISIMGIVALSGIVVNDSLVLVDATNEYRARGLGAYAAIHTAGLRRFRPILLTSLTTFFGLAPMIVETSVQARFLIPMAISLGFGVLFSTFVTLLLVPAAYMILEDLSLIWRFIRGRPLHPEADPPGEEHGPDPEEEPLESATAPAE